MLHPFQQHLNEREFTDLFKMDRDSFDELPNWKRISLKKSLGLF